jgi:glycosyltransferase involved in cell wall biosynthesis
MGADDMVQGKKMLVFHSAYTFDFLKEFGMEIFVQSRDAGNFFESVLTVSPIATLQYPQNDPRIFSEAELLALDSHNTILEGRVGRYKALRRFKLLNFIVAQISLIYKIVRFGELRKVALIRAEDPRFNGLYGYLFSKVLRKPLLVGVWGNPGRLRRLNGKPNMPRFFPSSGIEERLEHFILRRASMVLAQNTENMSYALEAGVDPKKTRITPLGVGIDKAHFLPLSARKDVTEDLKSWGVVNERILFCISRLEALKMVDHAIKACKILGDSKIPFKLILIGDGRERGDLQKLASELGIADDVIFAGNRNQDWIAGLMRHVDLNVAPLCGRALLEASLSGCPAVSYDVDWHDEIVHSGITGELIKNLDFKAMGVAIKTILLDDRLRSEMRENMSKLAVELASPERITAEQVKIYREVILN